MENSGLTKEDAIILNNVGSSAAGSHEIYKFIDTIFGANDGDYFIHSETTAEDKKANKKYRVILVEAEGRKGQIWFDITSWS